MTGKFKIGILTLVAAGAVVFLSADAYSHGYGGGYGHMGPGYGYGNMMGQGYGNGHMGSGYENYDYLKSEMGLSEKQIESMHKINSKYREKFFENRNNREKIYSLREEQQKEIASVFTKEQKEKFFGSRGNSRTAYNNGCGW